MQTIKYITKVYETNPYFRAFLDAVSASAQEEGGSVFKALKAESTNLTAMLVFSGEATVSAPKRVGRPKGSRNAKPAAEAAPASAAAPAAEKAASPKAKAAEKRRGKVGGRKRKGATAGLPMTEPTPAPAPPTV